MADTIKEISFGYNVYMITCQADGNTEYACRLSFMLNIFTYFVILIAFLIIIYLLKKDRDDNRHEE